MAEVCAQRESVNIVFRCVARVAKISCGVSDMFDRLIGVGYGDFGYRFSLPGGENDSATLVVYLRRAIKHVARTNRMGSPGRTGDAFLLFSFFVGVDPSKIGHVRAPAPADDAFSARFSRGQRIAGAQGGRVHGIAVGSGVCGWLPGIIESTGGEQSAGQGEEFERGDRRYADGRGGGNSEARRQLCLA